MSTVIGNLRVVLGLDSGAFQRGLSNATASLRGVGRNMQNIGAGMSAAVTAPLVGFGALSLKAAGDFEASMNRVQAATGASVDQMTDLEQAALEMGQTTQFKASQAAEAIEILAKNGLSAADIMGGALQGSMLLAASSGADLASSGDLATDVMLQFGKKAGDLTGLVDGMTGVLLTSKFGFDDYRLAVAQAGGVAGGLGVEFEDFNAAIAGTSSLFASGSDAGTSFKTFLQRLVPASAPAAAAMEELGLEFFNFDGSMKSMAEVSQELQDGLAGLSDEARNDALSTIFGTDALRTAIGLAEQGADGIDRLKASIGEVSATQQAEARMKGFNGEMLKLKSAVEALMIAVGNSGILEFATDLAQRFTSFMLRLKETNPELLKMGVIFGAVAVALGPVLVGLGLMIAWIGPLIGLVAALASPFGIAAAAIAAAGAAIYTNWDTVGPWFKHLATAIGQHFTGLVEILSGILTGDMAMVVQGFKDSWQGLTGFWEGLWDGLVATIEYAWETVIKPITDKLGMTDNILKGWQNVKAMFDTVLSGITAAFTGAWEKIAPIVTKLSSAFDRLNASRDGPISSGYDPSTDTGDAGLILPGAGGHIAQGLAGGTAGMRTQGVTDATEYGEGFREGMGIRSPSRVMIEIGEYMSQGLGIGIGNAGPLVDAASNNLGRSFADGVTPYFQSVIRGTQSVKDAFLGMLSDMAAQYAQSGLSYALGLIGSAFGSSVTGLRLAGGGDALTGALRGTGITVPGFANGVTDFAGGLATINERGGELVNLPNGSTVIPHDLSRGIIDRQNQSRDVNVQVGIDRNGNLQAYVTDMMDSGFAAYDSTLKTKVPGIMANRTKWSG
ncbi:phage tail tape measure protein [Paracoccus sp. JM45]|uniref:phage tail tape measure protein n=1 Tax=Paracoccus sp. JM45 TaxID=2283626 RepID=UPI000E6B9350|nr:phage tail tape measure protein [Paracoccus sp. JM45]RJE81275.1 phage tail tape measure protein [Paracoccus sp. JM45]